MSRATPVSRRPPINVERGWNLPIMRSKRSARRTHPYGSESISQPRPKQGQADVTQCSRPPGRVACQAFSRSTTNGLCGDYGKSDAQCMTAG